MGAFSVNVADHLHRPGARRREVVSGPMGGIQVVGSSMAEGATVVVDVELEWVSDGILATGDVRGPWRGECRRCLAPVGGELRVSSRELFEAVPKEGDTYPLRGDRIDLELLAQEALTVELPLAPVCTDDCRGLCPVCGADLNLAPCACTQAERDTRWAALDALRAETDDAEPDRPDGPEGVDSPAEGSEGGR